MAKPKIKSDGKIITVRVPISIRKRGGRKVVLAPDGSRREAGEFRCRQIDNVLVKALARAFRWREMLESGSYCTIKEIAEAEKIAETYVGRILRLSLLAPEIVEAILAARQGSHITLPFLMLSLPLEWSRQRLIVRSSTPTRRTQFEKRRHSKSS